MTDQAQPPVSDSFVAPRPRKKATGPWLAGGLVFVVLASIISGFVAPFQGAGQPAFDIASAVGWATARAAIITVVIFAPIWLFGLRPARRGNGLKYFAIMLGAAFLVGQVSTAAGGAVAQQQKIRDTIHAVTRQAVAEQEAEAAKVEAELLKPESLALFEPRALKAAGGYAKARKELDRRRAVLAQAKANGAGRTARMRATLVAVFPTKQSRENAGRQFDIGAARRAEEVAAYWRLQDASFANTEAQLALLERVRWTPEYGEFAFYRTADLEAFNALAEKEARLQQEIATTATRANAEGAEMRQRLLSY